MKRRFLAAAVALAALLAACSDSDSGSEAEVRADGAANEDTTGGSGAGDSGTTGPAGDESDAGAGSEPGESETPESAGSGGRSERVIGSTSTWTTDWSKATIDLSELAVGIASRDPRDAIPPIYDAKYTSIDEADWLQPQDPGALVDVDGDVRFFPLAIMTRHEIVNDEIGGLPVAVTYCPLCNTAVAFERTIDGEEILLGVSGLLRNSDLVMWDHDTVSLYQQITGEAIVGERAGQRLPRLSTAIVSFADLQENHPDALVLSTDTGFGIAYGSNPYRGYSSLPAPFAGFADPPTDERFAALERVVGVTVDDVDKAYSFGQLEEELAINDEVNGVPIAVLWGGVTADALDQTAISESRNVGTGIAFLATVDGQTLTFSPAGDDRFTDAETGTTWSLLGSALDGPLAGSQLELAVHTNEFWFAFAAFFPDAEVWEG